MPKRKSGCGKFLLIGFGLLMGLGVIGGLMNPQDRRRAEKGTKPDKKQQEPEPSPIFDHGFRVGYGMAKTGMVKPDSAQLDAMARQSALQMGHSGGLGFKMQWKQGFSVGWSQGD